MVSQTSPATARLLAAKLTAQCAVREVAGVDVYIVVYGVGLNISDQFSISRGTASRKAVLIRSAQGDNHIAGLTSRRFVDMCRCCGQRDAISQNRPANLILCSVEPDTRSADTIGVGRAGCFFCTREPCRSE